MRPELDPSLLAGCGTYCGFCLSHTGEEGPPCNGCIATRGHPWWSRGKPCSVYSCADEKGLSHHGECASFPCPKLLDHHNPENPHGQRNTLVRVGLLATRAAHGPEKVLELHRKLGRPPQT